jgi:hypothetical protein
LNKDEKKNNNNNNNTIGQILPEVAGLALPPLKVEFPPLLLAVMDANNGSVEFLLVLLLLLLLLIFPPLKFPPLKPEEDNALLLLIILLIFPPLLLAVMDANNGSVEFVLVLLLLLLLLLIFTPLKFPPLKPEEDDVLILETISVLIFPPLKFPPLKFPPLKFPLLVISGIFSLVTILEVEIELLIGGIFCRGGAGSDGGGVGLSE